MKKFKCDGRGRTSQLQRNDREGRLLPSKLAHARILLKFRSAAWGSASVDQPNCQGRRGQHRHRRPVSTKGLSSKAGGGFGSQEDSRQGRAGTACSMVARTRRS